MPCIGAGTATVPSGVEVWSIRLPGREIRYRERAHFRIGPLIDALEDSDDVQNVYANFDVSDDVMAAVD